MKTIHRDYAEESGDFHRLCQFVTQNNAYLRRHSTWSLGRVVDWKYGLYPGKRAYPAFTDQNAHLWFDGYGQMAGFVICENGDAGFTILTLPGYRFLFEEMLHWTLQAWQARGPQYFTEVTEHQGHEMRVLEGCGFLRKAPFFSRRFDLTGEMAPRFPLEEGFSVVDMQSHPDDIGQRLMRSNAFSGKQSLTEEELQDELKFTNYSHQGPLYHAPTDVCVMAPDGTIVAGCEALIDGVNAEADIERVATHDRYRHRGFARAAIQECLYRLREIGMRNAYITGYSQAAIALYGSLGAVDEVQNFVYERG
ncbi:MAG: GNAT family N-acetyltransferase [Anaerolineae bacterium]|nr:GNAT family N-acetyltransferase [Anaerolineae bacterium]